MLKSDAAEGPQKRDLSSAPLSVLPRNMGTSAERDARVTSSRPGAMRGMWRPPKNLPQAQGTCSERDDPTALSLVSVHDPLHRQGTMHGGDLSAQRHYATHTESLVGLPTPT
jgi:hypothetical protein